MICRCFNIYYCRGGVGHLFPLILRVPIPNIPIKVLSDFVSQKRLMQLCHIHERTHATHARTHARMHARTRTHARARTHACTHSCMQRAHAHACVYACIHARTHARTRIHIRALQKTKTCRHSLTGSALNPIFPQLINTQIQNIFPFT